MGLLDSLRSFYLKRKVGNLSLEENEKLQNLTITQEDFEEMQKITAQMTPFDFQVGRLCANTFSDFSDKALYYGMLEIIKCALSGGLDESVSAKDLLEIKSKQNAQAEDIIFQSSVVAEKICEEDGLKMVKDGSKKNGVPNIVGLTTILVETFEIARPRPTAQVRELRMGHYAVLAEFVFAVGLKILVNNPIFAKELTGEPL